MSRRFYLDMLERVAWTFTQAFAAEWLVTSTADAWSLKVGLTGGLIAAAKCIVATRIGDRNSASTVASV